MLDSLVISNQLAETTTEAPFVTIIMPIYNEAKFIEGSLRSVLSQDFPSNRMEVLVVDGMSTDGTREIIRNLVNEFTSKDNGNLQVASRFGRFQPTVHLLDNRARIVSTALNLGLKHARGDVIIRIDGHCEVPIDYIIRCVEELQKREADCVGGQIMTCGETWIGRGISLAQASFFGVGGVAFRAGRKSSGYVDTLAFGAYRKSVFNRLGTFDVDLVRNQDDEFNFRLLQAGGRIWMDNTIHVKYHARSNFIKLWKQYSQYGLYKVLVMKKRGALPSMRSLVPGTFVLSLIISLAVAIWGGTIKPILATAGTYIFGNLVAAFWVARKDWRVLPLLPLAFAILHFAYGSGFLVGLLRWRSK